MFYLISDFYFLIYNDYFINKDSFSLLSRIIFGINKNKNFYYDIGKTLLKNILYKNINYCPQEKVNLYYRWKNFSWFWRDD